VSMANLRDRKLQLHVGNMKYPSLLFSIVCVFKSCVFKLDARFVLSLFKLRGMKVLGVEGRPEGIS
jgi:hypothetical protein